MANFTVRVELIDKLSSDYELLHEEMKKEGFSTTIKKTNEPSYKLPPAEYSKIGDFTTLEVLESAKIAATNVCGNIEEDFRVLVTKSEVSREWYNLEPVK